MLKSYGFKQNNIITLINQEATKRNIVKAFDLLTDRVKKGDRIYLHFSCHGQQVVDLNDDEPDGLDEAIIPYDAMRRFKSGVYEGENHLIDDEIEIYLDRLRTKTGAS